MQRVDLIKVLGDDASSFEAILKLSSIDQIALLDRISEKTNKLLKADNFKIAVLVKNYNSYITYKFRYKGALYKAAFKCDESSNIDKLLNAIIDIADGLEAIDYINNRVKQNKNETTIQIRWSKSANANIVNWDYESIDIGISDNTLNIILNEYRKGTDKFISWVDSICDSPILAGISDIIKDADRIEMLNKLNIDLSTDNIEETLLSCMIDRNTAIKLMAESRESMSKQTLRSVEVIQGLGRFAAIVVWKANYKEHQIDNYLLDGHVLDLDTFKIVTNTEICNRIENIITIKDDERDRILIG